MATFDSDSYTDGVLEPSAGASGVAIDTQQHLSLRAPQHIAFKLLEIEDQASQLVSTPDRPGPGEKPSKIDGDVPSALTWRAQALTCTDYSLDSGGRRMSNADSDGRWYWGGIGATAVADRW